LYEVFDVSLLDGLDDFKQQQFLLADVEVYASFRQFRGGGDLIDRRRCETVPNEQRQSRIVNARDTDVSQFLIGGSRCPLRPIAWFGFDGVGVGHVNFYCS
jgi:hypothetical protein